MLDFIKLLGVSNSVNSQLGSLFFRFLLDSWTVTNCSSALFTNNSSNEFVELWSFHGQELLSFLNNSNILGNGSGSNDVVACDHSYSDSSLVAVSNGLRNLLSWNISHSNDAEQDDVILFTGKYSLLIFGFNIFPH